jgi:CspA family cold shock protein
MKGWGFIEPDGGDRDVFVHYESIIGEGFRNLEKGDRVRFRIEDTPKGPKAVDVMSIEVAVADSAADFAPMEDAELDITSIETPVEDSVEIPVAL